MHPFILLVVFLALGNDTFAARPRAQELIGIVQSVDLQSREITVASETFELTKQTRFIANSGFVRPETLKAGDKVKLHYRSPFIGKKFAMKVTWSANPPNGDL